MSEPDNSNPECKGDVVWAVIAVISVVAFILYITNS